MSLNALLLRKQELARRVESLPHEVAAWRAATSAALGLNLNAHFSQLRAIEILTDAIVAEQRAQIAVLDPAGDATVFQTQSFELIKSLMRAQRAWDYFRDKLNLRFSDIHKDALWTTDTIAWDCHRPILEKAAMLGLIDSNELREPPLTYCAARYSPATWVRGSRPNDGRVYDLGEVRLPIPVIELPWEHLGNAWEYLAIHHEVGHDLEADLGLRRDLKDALSTALANANVGQHRIKIWVKWTGEIFADFCALQLAGPAFAEGLMQLLLLPAEQVKIYNEEDPHPTAHLRIFLNAAYVRSMGDWQEIENHAAAIETDWIAIYGDEYTDETLKSLADDFEVVIKALTETQFARLGNQTLKQFISYAQADDLKIRAAERFFKTNMNRPADLPIRHTASAARIAVTSLTRDGTLTNQACADVHGRVLGYVSTVAPQGLRGVNSAAHEKFVASFAERMGELNE